MNAVQNTAGDGAWGDNTVRGLIGTAFAGGEPALPDLDDVLASVQTLGAGIRRRQRVRGSVAAVALCLGAFGMIAGIATVAHQTHSGGGTVIVPGGSGGPMAPDLSNSDTTPDTGH